MVKKINLHQQAADKTRLKILEAAQKLFVKLGFSGTSIGAIAKEANINQSLIYHYFENKEDLWRQVKKDLISQIGNNTDNLLEAPAIETLDELLIELVDMRYKIYANKPDLIRMLFWQALEDQGPIIAGTSSSWVNSWIQVIEKLKNEGKISSPLNAGEIMVLLNGIVWAPLISHNIVTYPVDGESFCTKMRELLKECLCQPK